MNRKDMQTARIYHARLWLIEAYNKVAKNGEEKVKKGGFSLEI